MTTCTRILAFDAAHRLVNHEGKCAHLHGHRYTVEVECSPSLPGGPLDSIGRVLDFSVIKDVLGKWIDDRLDHGILVNEDDDELRTLLVSLGETRVYCLPCNPTAENIAAEIMRVGQGMLSGVRLVRVRVWETPNAFAEVRA